MRLGVPPSEWACHQAGAGFAHLGASSQGGGLDRGERGIHCAVRPSALLLVFFLLQWTNSDSHRPPHAEFHFKSGSLGQIWIPAEMKTSAFLVAPCRRKEPLICLSAGGHPPPNFFYLPNFCLSSDSGHFFTPLKNCPCSSCTPSCE